MGFEMRKKEKFKSAERFVEQMKEIQGEARAALAKAQEDIVRATGAPDSRRILS